MAEVEQCTTVGQLKAAIAELPDDAPLVILFDTQCGISESIAVVEPDDPWGYAKPGTVYLDISEGQ